MALAVTAYITHQVDTTKSISATPIWTLKTTPDDDRRTIESARDRLLTALAVMRVIAHSDRA